MFLKNFSYYFGKIPKGLFILTLTCVKGEVGGGEGELILPTLLVFP